MNSDAFFGLSCLAGCAFMFLLAGIGIGLAIWKMFNRKRNPPVLPADPPRQTPPIQPEPASPVRCPDCGHPLTPASPGCPRCRPASSRFSASGPREELATAERVLKRLYQSQAIGLPVYDAVWQALTVERERLSAPQTAPSGPPPAIPAIPAIQPDIPAATAGVSPGGAPAAEVVIPPAHPPAEPAAMLPPPGIPAAVPPPSLEPLPLPPTSAPAAASGHPPAAPAHPPRPSMLSAFMEERNIRWGELLGGLLIIGSTIALVISLWSTIRQFPLLQMGLFIGFSLLLFGVGLYTGHRWRLQTTSRALLIIAVMLVPLDFLGLAALGADPGHFPAPLLILLAAAALAVFAPLLYLAGRFMTPAWPMLFWPGVLAVSAYQVALPFLAGSPPALSVVGLLGLGLPPVALYGLTCLALRRRARPPASPVPDLAQPLFILFGTATFAVFFPLGLLVYRTGDAEWAFRSLAPWLPLLGGTAGWLGLSLWRDLDPDGRPLLRTVCLGVGLAGGGLALLGLPTAWPCPASLAAVAVIGCVMFGFAALRFNLPGLHGVAIGLWAAGFLAGGLAATGEVGWWSGSGPLLAKALVSASSGRLLTVLFLLLAVLGEAWGHRRQAEAFIYAWSAGIAALVGTLLLCAHGLGRSGDPEMLRWLLPLYAAAAGYGAVRLRQAGLGWFAVVLLLGGAIQWLVCYRPPAHPWPVALLTHGSLCLAMAAGLRWRRLGWLNILELPARSMAIVSSAAAAVALLVAVWTSPVEPMAWRSLWLSLLWIGLGWLGGWPAWRNAGQVALQASLAFGVAHHLQLMDWYQAEKAPFFHPWALQIQGIAAAGLALAWTLLRTGWRRRVPPERHAAPFGRMLLGSRLPVDQVVLLCSVVVLATMVLVGILPEIFRECTPVGAPNTPGLKFAQARGGLAWFWWAALLSAGLASLAETCRRWKVLTMLVLAVIAGPLVAGTQVPARTVATTWRWWLALFFCLAALPLWSGLRRWLARRTGWPGAAAAFDRLGDGPRILLLALTIPPLLGLAFFPVIVALAGKFPAGPAPGTVWHWLGAVLNQAVPFGVVTLGLLAWAAGRRSVPLAALAGATLHFTVLIAFAWHRLTGDAPLALSDGVTLCQWMAVTAAAFIAGWLAFRHWRPAGAETSSPDWILPVLWFWLGLAWCFNLLILLPALGGVFFQPGRPLAVLETAGQPLGWLAAVLAGAAGAGLWPLARRRFPLAMAALPLLAVVVLAGCTISPGDEGRWSTFHLLAAGFCLAAWVLWLPGRLPRCREWFGGERAVPGSLRWTCLSAGLTVAFAVRAIGQDPARPWWTVGLLLALALLFHLAGQGRRQQAYLFLGGLLAQAAVTVWWATRYWEHPTDLIGALYWNAIAASVQVLCWLAWRRWRDRGPGPVFEAGFLRTCSWAALALHMFVLGVTLVRVLADPGRMDLGLPKVGGPLGWLALLLAVAAWLGVRLALRRPLRWGMLWLLAMTPVSLAAFGAYRWENTGWLGFHLLNLGWLLAGAVNLAAGWRLDKAGPLWPARLNWPDHASKILPVASRWTAISAIVTVALCACGIGRDPGWPGWESAILALAGLLIGALGLWTAGRWQPYGAALLTGTALYFWRTGSPEWLGRPAQWMDLWNLEIVVLSMSGLFWLAVELRRSRASRIAGESGSMPPAGADASPTGPEPTAGPEGPSVATGFTLSHFHVVALIGAACTLAAATTNGLLADWRLAPLDSSEPLGWLAWAITLTLGIAFLWAPGDRQAGSVLYLLGLLGLGRWVDGQNLTPRWLLWTGHLLAAAWVMLTGWGWPRLGRLEEWLRQRFKTLPRTPLAERCGAVMPVFGILCGLVVTAAFWVVFTFPEPGPRLAAAAALLAAGAGQACLARDRGTRDSALAALGFGLLAILAFGWAFQQPGLATEAGTTGQASGWPLLPADFRHRVLVLLAVLAAVTFPYGFGLIKLARAENPWVAAARRLMGPLSGLGLASLAMVLGSEFVDEFALGSVHLGPLAVALVAVSLGALVGLALLFAVVPGRDPFQLDERGRRVYVWTAEILLVLLLAHLRLTMPWLFSGFFEQIWPLVVIVLAFIGVGLGEFFERQGREVLAAPLRQTGALLPLLPVLGFWVLPSRVHFTLVMILAGIVYGTLSLVRRSFLFGLVSALAANIGLWYYLFHAESLAFHRHPQLWLIPLAVAVLLAATVHRRQLPPAQLTLIRYTCMVTIYASSTADIFIQGVRSIWLPLVLAGLSVCGALAGILLRLRSFLILGTAFLGIALLAMIWHAHEHLGWTWIWWVAGIVAGAIILVIFGLFEKKRDQLNRSLDRLKTWDS